MAGEVLPKEGDKWQAFKNEAKRDVVFADFAYTTALDLPDENYFIKEAIEDFTSSYADKAPEDRESILIELSERAKGIKGDNRLADKLLELNEKLRIGEDISQGLREVSDEIPVSNKQVDMSEEIDRIAKKLPRNFELFFCSDTLDETKKHQYRALAFVNNQTKEIVVATSGTRFGLDAVGRQDIYDDMFIAFEKEPPKMKSVREFNSMIVDSLGADISEYKVHYTGHSLGAGVSDMAAADLAIKCRKKGLTKESGMPEISTLTFENPGAKKVIQKMYKDAGFNQEEYSQDVDYKGINNGKNLVNRATQHAGIMYEIQPSGNKKPNMFQTFLMYVSSKLEPFLIITPKILNTIAFGRLSKQIESHKLSKIEDFLCMESPSQGFDTVENINRDLNHRVEKKVNFLSDLVGSVVTLGRNWVSSVQKSSSNSRGL